MLKPRSAAVLHFLVKEFVESATPVASDTIVRRAGLSVSPATIRNEMAELEREGYVTRPHISAGAIPTDLGYRHYVESYLSAAAPPQPFAQDLRARFASVHPDWEAWSQTAAGLLAGMTTNLSVVTLPRAVHARLRHLELVRVQDYIVLLVLVLEQARLRQHLISLERPVEIEELERATGKLNDAFGGLTRREIARKHAGLTPFEVLVREKALDTLAQEEQRETVDHVVDGLRLLLAQPEFRLSDRARAVAEALEERILIRYLLSQMTDDQRAHVVIGSENREEALRPFGIVFCQYGVPGEEVGVVSVVGPTRMPYDTTVKGMYAIASLLTSLSQTLHGPAAANPPKRE